MSAQTTYQKPSDELLSFRQYPMLGEGTAAHTYLVEVSDASVSRVFEEVMPLMARLLQEKSASIRSRRLEEMVDFMTAQLVVPSEVNTKMAQRLARRRAAILNEFGFFTAEQLADLNNSAAIQRNALADNWRKRGQVFSVPHPDKAAREGDIYPAFQFDEGRPLKVIQEVLAALGPDKSAWKTAFWFAANNGWLPDSARPVDLLHTNPAKVVEAAKRDADIGAAV